MSYRNLDIWKKAKENSIAIHKMTLNDLPAFENYEVGTQIRRSSKSVQSNIVEGYGRKRYPGDYLRFLIYAQASNDETIDHLETLYDTGSLKDEKLFKDLQDRIDHVGKMLNNFIKKVEQSI